jgi:predicted ATPase
LALLNRHLGGEGPPLLLLAGEPGIGKSRLLREVVPYAHAAGWTVLAGTGQRGGQDPYAPLVDAFAAVLRGRPPAGLRGALHQCAWLVRLLPELAVLGPGVLPPLPAWTLRPEQERRFLVETVLRFLGNLAGPAGTLLVLDDLQWAGADAPTRAILNECRSVGCAAATRHLFEPA